MSCSCSKRLQGYSAIHGSDWKWDPWDALKWSKNIFELKLLSQDLWTSPINKNCGYMELHISPCGVWCCRPVSAHCVLVFCSTSRNLYIMTVYRRIMQHQVIDCIYNILQHTTQPVVHWTSTIFLQPGCSQRLLPEQFHSWQIGVSIGYPNGWFTREHPIVEMDDLGVPVF